MNAALIPANVEKRNGSKLMKIPAFLWAYTKFRQAKAWLEATAAWQAIRAISKAARQYVTEMKKSASVAFRQS